MTRVPAARIAWTTPEVPKGPSGSPPPLGNQLVIATITPRTPPVGGADWLRVDGGLSPLRAAALRQLHAAERVLLDIPGPDTPRQTNPLTTTELVVFGASEGFDWMNLSSVDHPRQMENALRFVGGSTRLSCSISDPAVLFRHLDDLCELGDAIFLDLPALGKKLPPRQLLRTLRMIPSRTREHATPTLLISGLRPAVLGQTRGAAAELGRLGTLLGTGYAGIMLTSETALNPRPQSAIDLARTLVCGAGGPAHFPPSGAAIHVRTPRS